jgi:hypothetical protein
LPAPLLEPELPLFDPELPLLLVPLPLPLDPPAVASSSNPPPLLDDSGPSGWSPVVPGFDAHAPATPAAASHITCFESDMNEPPAPRATRRPPLHGRREAAGRRSKVKPGRSFRSDRSSRRAAGRCRRRPR